MWANTAHLKPKTLTALNACENVGQQELSFVASGVTKWYNLSWRQPGDFFSFFLLLSFFFFFHLFLLGGGYLLYNIVVVFPIHWHESAMDLHVFPILIPAPAALSIPSLWVFPVHQPWALVSGIQPGLVICFTLDSIFVSMLFSQNIPPSPPPTESKSLFCTSVSRFLFCI